MKQKPTEMYQTTFSHIHIVNGFAISTTTRFGTNHVCMRYGYWCFDQIKEQGIKSLFEFIQFWTIERIKCFIYKLGKTV